MCIIVDTNNLSRVFNPNNAEHKEFVPVFEWILRGTGKLVIGGSTFNKEVSSIRWFLPFLGQLSRIGKVVKIDDHKVDLLRDKIIDEVAFHRDFDDQHLVSLLAISGCKLICSDDSRAFPYFTKSDYFHRGHRPKIYSSSRNSDLLVDGNICKKCKPKLLINKNTAELLEVISNQVVKK